MSISAVMNLLKPAPHQEEIRDQNRVREDYQYWRIRIFYSIYIGYIFYYFTRQSLAFVIPFISDDLGMSKSQIGWFVTILSISYGCSKFVSGIWSDRANPRYFMAFGLILTGIFNILFGLSSSLVCLYLFWGLNGWFQGFGWPACTKQLTYWFSRSERGTWWSASTTSQTVGGFVIAHMAAYCGQIWGWRIAMFIPGVLCIFIGLLLVNRLRDVPQSLGLPPIEKFKGERIYAEENEEKPMSVKQILFEQVLTNKYVWVLAISYFFVYVVRTGVNWLGQPYLVETKDYTPYAAAACIAWFDVGGFLGMLAAGWGSDNLFQGRRVPFMVLCSLGLIFAITALWYLGPGQYVLTSFLVALIGFLVFGPQMLVGLASAEFVSKKAASASNGFAGFLGYLGSAVAGWPLGIIIDYWGWWGFFMSMVICSMATMLILLPIWSLKTTEEPKSREQRKGEEQKVSSPQLA